VQILTVRYLSLTDYGAFAYALAIVNIGQSLATLGLDRAMPRFVPIYEEQKDYDRLFGVLLLVMGTILAIGLSVALSVQFLTGFSRSLIDNHQAHAVLLVLIFLVPIQAVDDLVVGLFAVFAEPRAIFFRRHVVAPLLKLTVVLFLVVGKSTVLFLAGGYLAASIAGAAVYVVVLVRMLRRSGLFSNFHWRSVRVPWREVLAFALPLFLSDLVFVAINSVSVLMLEHFRGFSEVALLRAQQPVAAMNQTVMMSFATLFTPLAARMFARNDRARINDLYWQTAMWIAVLTFPVFVLTFSVAEPITGLLLGPRHRGSGMLLALLALGYYFNAALGFNGLTLKVCGKMRYVMAISLVTVMLSLIVNLALIPTLGMLGAAIGTCVAMIVHNILKQAGLRLGTGVDLFERRYLKGYAVIVAAATGVLLLQWMIDPPVFVSIGLAAAASWIVFRVNRPLLQVEQNFPELHRKPIVRWLLGGARLGTSMSHA
jgi:O-antigen/teichoic acid export membrane protein